MELPKDVKEKIETLKAEIDALEREAREDIPAQMQSAQAVGPVRENADMYLVAGRAHYIQGRIANLSQQLRALRAWSGAGVPKDCVGYGSTLELLDLDTGKRRRMRIASPEAVEDGETCTLASPMGRALAGKRKGDEVEVRIPVGTRLYRIERLVNSAVSEDVPGR